MLADILNSVPPLKYVLIQDSLDESGRRLVSSIIRRHLALKQHSVHYFAFERHPKQVEAAFGAGQLEIHDFFTGCGNWAKGGYAKDFIDFKSEMEAGCVVIVDSLALALVEYGLSLVYRIIHRLMTWESSRLVQLVCLLHTDMLEDRVNTVNYLESQCTLSVVLEPPDKTQYPIVQFTHNKTSGKIIKQIEEYFFEGDTLRSQMLKRLDLKAHDSSGQQNVSKWLSSSTFKISLSDGDKRSRDGLVLPYLKEQQPQQPPQQPQPQQRPGREQEKGEGGRILYQMEDNDDWDQEDPDNDLDI